MIAGVENRENGGAGRPATGSASEPEVSALLRLVFLRQPTFSRGCSERLLPAAARRGVFGEFVLGWSGKAMGLRLPLDEPLPLSLREEDFVMWLTR